MTKSLRDSILAADDLERKEVTVDGWEFPVFVRVISGRERQQLVEKWQQVKEDEAKQQDLLPFVCALCLVDADGGRPFDPTDAGDLDLLKSKGARQLEALYHEAMKLNGMEDDSLDEAVANFSEGQS